MGFSGHILVLLVDLVLPRATQAQVLMQNRRQTLHVAVQHLMTGAIWPDTNTSSLASSMQTRGEGAADQHP